MVAPRQLKNFKTIFIINVTLKKLVREKYICTSSHKTLVRAKYFACGSPRNPPGSRPFALRTILLHTKLWCEQSTSPAARLATLRVLAPLHYGLYFFTQNFGASKVLRLRLASQPSGFSPLCITDYTSSHKTLVRAKGLEPSTSTLARLRSSQLSYARTVSHILTYLFLHCK